jgi:hypothetical protein
MWLFCKRNSLTEVRRFYGVEMNVVKTTVMNISRQLSPVHIMTGKNKKKIKKTGKCSIFQLCGQHVNKRCQMYM